MDGKTQIQFRIDKNLHAAFKAYCAKNAVSMTDVFVYMIKSVLTSRVSKPADPE